ncbi:MAG: hypothetical protein M3Q80_00850, partial [bacterium]|nr:hypothetical protein [bacterium]
SSVSVWVRYQDDANNLACDFGNGFIHIIQSVNGQQRVIKGETGSSMNFPGGKFTVEAQVKDRTIRCILNGNKVVESQFLDKSLLEGGIGFKTWTERPGVAALNIHKVKVDEI